MKSRHTLERRVFRALLDAAADTRLPDRQINRERRHTFVQFFQPKITKRKGFKRRALRDMERRNKAREAALEDEQVIPNRAMKRAMGDRGYGYGLGHMAVPKTKRRAP